MLLHAVKGEPSSKPQFYLVGIVLASQDMEINIPQSAWMVGFESVHDNNREDRRFRYRTASLCRDRSADIKRLNDEIVALDAIIKVP